MLKRLQSRINREKLPVSAIITTSFLVILSLSFIFPDYFTHMNARINDRFFRLRYWLNIGNKEDSPIIHVDISDHDITYLKQSHKDASLYHNLLDILTEADVSMIGVDVVFNDNAHDENNRLLANTSKKGRLYYPVVLNEELDLRYNSPVLQERLLIKPDNVKPGQIAKSNILYTPFPELMHNARGLGHINCMVDPDGVNRKVPLVYTYDDTGRIFIPGLALRMICDYLKVDINNIEVIAGKHIILKRPVMAGGIHDRIKIPIDKKGRMTLNWRGPWESSYPAYSAKKVLLSGIDPVFKDILKNELAGKIIIVSDISIRNKDWGLGVYSKSYPLSRIHATIMDNILTENFIKPVSPGFVIIALVLLILGMHLAAYYFRPIGFIVASIAIFVLFPAAGFLIFLFFKYPGYLFVPGLFVIVSCVAITGYNLYLALCDKITISERSKLKTNFFINIAHETKTPLTLIINYLDRYIKKKGLDEDLTVIKQNIGKLKEDMVNFMDAEALEIGRTIYGHDVILEVNEFISHKINIFKELYTNKYIGLSLDMPEEKIYLAMHPAALERVMNNLLENAYKYGNEGGETNVRLSCHDDEVIIRVSDTGIGISPKDQADIFEPYYQVSKKKGSSRGMGMGLYIVKKIVNEAGGSLSLQSKPGEGSTFTVSLPLSQPGQTAPDGVITRSYEHSPMVIPEPVIVDQPFDENKNTIMIVDDNHQMLQVLHNELCGQYNILYADNGLKALEVLKNTDEIPSVIVSDIVMDEIDGYTFYQKLNGDSRYHSVPFIFITAKTGYDERIKALNLGAVAFMSKPFLIDELKAEIASLIELQVSIMYSTEEKRIQDDKARTREIFENCNFTKTEQKVVQHVLEGLLNKEIADILKVKEQTVKFHLTNIYKKCQVFNRVELINKLK